MTKLEYCIAYWDWRVSDIIQGWWEVNEAYKVWKLTIIRKFPYGSIWDYL
jgi:hypothetical protein